MIDRLAATATALSVVVTATAVAVDWTALAVAAIAATPPSLIAYFGYRSSQAAVRMAASAHEEAQAAHASSVATGKAVDGVKTELVEAVRGRALSEGRAAGVQEGKAIERAQLDEVKTALDTPNGHDASAVGVLVETPQEPVQPSAASHPRRLRRPKGPVDT